MNFVWGTIGVIVGVLVIKFSMQITDTFGTIDWAEEHLHGGMAGTYTLYKLVGVVIIILSFLYMFGSMGFLVGPLAPLFRGGK
jgi:hypothetical protein